MLKLGLINKLLVYLIISCYSYKANEGLATRRNYSYGHAAIRKYSTPNKISLLPDICY